MIWRPDLLPSSGREGKKKKTCDIEMRRRQALRELPPAAQPLSKSEKNPMSWLAEPAHALLCCNPFSDVAFSSS
nr:hypothetical protein CFP56_53761 [Quercus suber]